MSPDTTVNHYTAFSVNVPWHNREPLCSFQCKCPDTIVHHYAAFSVNVPWHNCEPLCSFQCECPLTQLWTTMQLSVWMSPGTIVNHYAAFSVNVPSHTCEPLCSFQCKCPLTHLWTTMQLLSLTHLHTSAVCKHASHLLKMHSVQFTKAIKIKTWMASF